MQSGGGPTIAGGWMMLPLALVATAIVLALSQAAGAAVRFTDPASDSGAAPDMTNVDVGNDVVAGPIVIWVELPNRESFAGSDLAGVFLDTDLNRATGAVAFGGIEFIIEVEGPAFRLYRWNGSDIEQVASPSLRADFIASVKSLRIEIHPNDVGGTRGFNFWILTVTGEANDIAPDGASLWTYSLSPGPLVLSVERFTTSPSRARAGRTFTAAMVAGREDLNEILEEGTITCTLKIGKRTIRATFRRFVDATATCRWRVPTAAKGQRYSGSVAVAFGGKTVRRAFSGKVR